MLMSSINHTLVKVSVEVLDTPLLRTSSQVNFSQPSSSTQPSHALVPSNTYLENPYPMAKHVGVDEQGMYLDDGDEHVVMLRKLDFKGLSVKNPSMNLRMDVHEDKSQDGLEDESQDDCVDESMVSDGIP
uniref:Uncharacterized protein n=2 Tax=Oryza TaxID=4527 RepID=A0A0E0QIS2_ORYRU